MTKVFAVAIDFIVISRFNQLDKTDNLIVVKTVVFKLFKKLFGLLIFRKASLLISLNFMITQNQKIYKNC